MVVYLPRGRGKISFEGEAEWIDPGTGVVIPAGRIGAGCGRRSGRCVLYLESLGHRPRHQLVALGSEVLVDRVGRFYRSLSGLPLATTFKLTGPVSGTTLETPDKEQKDEQDRSRTARREAS